MNSKVALTWIALSAGVVLLGGVAFYVVSQVAREAAPVPAKVWVEDNARVEERPPPRPSLLPVEPARVVFRATPRSTDVERLPREAGDKSLAYYKRVCEIMEEREKGLEEAVKLGNLNGAVPDVKILATTVVAAHKQAASQLKFLGQNGVDDRMVEVTGKLKGYLESQADLAAGYLLITRGDDEVAVVSMKLFLPQLQRTWGPDAILNHSYQRWLIERYGIDGY